LCDGTRNCICGCETVRRRRYTDDEGSVPRFLASYLVTIIDYPIARTDGIGTSTTTLYFHVMPAP
jgi:hypothetical protein